MNDPNLTLSERLENLASDTSGRIRFDPGQAFPQRHLLREAAETIRNLETELAVVRQSPPKENITP